MQIAFNSFEMKKHGMANKSGLIRFALALLIAFVFLSVFSKNSYLYPMNDWVDANCFFTVARSMMDGKVLYRDICEQKGPFVYFIFELAALVSRTSFIGVFLIELLCFAAFLYFGDECVRLYRPNIALSSSISVMALLAFSTTISLAFSHGGSVEELSLFMLTLSLLTVLRAVKRNERIKPARAALIGVFAGVALWSKFTVLGFYLGLCAFVILRFLKRGEYAELLKNAAAFVGGAAAVTLPILAYFIANNALDALWETYFYNNIILYPSIVENGVALKLLSPAVNLAKGAAAGLVTNGLCSVPLVFGAYYLITRRKTRKDEALAVAFCVVPLAVTSFIGGKLYAPYYALIMVFCAPLGMAAMLKFFEGRARKELRAAPGAARAMLIVAVLALIGIPLSRNTRLLVYKRADMPQYRFAKVINAKENATLLNYGFLDGGFYFAAENIPKCKYFCELNIELDEMFAEQKRSIEACEVDYVVTRGRSLDDLGVDRSGYELLRVSSFPFENRVYAYYLYGLKDIGR